MSTLVTPTFNMPNTDAFAKELSGNTNCSFIEWYDALTQAAKLAHGANIDPDGFILLARSSSQASTFILIIEALSEYTKENPYGDNALNLLFSYVRNSQYELQAWVDALEYFYKWLEQNNRHASFVPMLSYIKGCIGPSAPEQGTLRELVSKVLDTYGYQD